MKKHISALSLLWISLTSMIGSGWLFGSLYSAHYAGPAALLAWPMAAVMLLFVALTYAEVSTMFPQAHSLHRLPLFTHGYMTSVVMSGLAWISLATIPVIETQGIVQYLSNYFPSLVEKNEVYYTVSFIGYLFALILMATFVVLNYFTIKLFSKINAGFTIWKIVIPAITVVMLLKASDHPQNFTDFGGFMPYGWNGVMAAMSSGGVLFSLLGFRQVVIMMSEIENPGKYVPIILVSSLVLTAILYTGLQWSFIASMRPEDLANGWAHLAFPGDAGPFAALASIAGMAWLSGLLYVDAFISPYSTGLVYTTTAGRVLAGMGATKSLPNVVAKKNKYHAPWVSLFINFLLGAFMFLVLRNWQSMTAFFVAVQLVSYAIAPVCLVSLRKQIPGYNRPFKLRFSNLITFIAFYICTCGAYWTGYTSVVRLMMLTAVCLVAYLTYCFYIKVPFQKLDIKNSLWIIAYFVGLIVFSHFGNYGGTGEIPMFYDLLWLMVFSLIIFILAQYSRMPSEYTRMQCNKMDAIVRGL